MNTVIDTLLHHRSIRRFTDEKVPESLIETLVRAGQQAPFTGQMYTVIVCTDEEKRREIAEHFEMAGRAPVFMLFCVDFRKLEKFIAAKGRKNRMEEIALLILGVQDMAYMAQNVVTAAESVGLGTCFLGGALWVEELATIFELPQRVIPVVGMVLGYPDQDPPVRPRIPLECILNYNTYHDMTDEEVGEALTVMDAGLIREGYYLKLQAKIPVEHDSETYDTYGWGEHVSRKYGLAFSEIDGVVGRILKERGMNL
ncbi:MAG: nitroreductase family protein [Theionarchaea archaeon]|nr:nitroreductase family protein [Theionarchaea archaeon]MBU7036765.1 nitroreductase family protein [Theionarchaea archaeon]